MLEMASLWFTMQYPVQEGRDVLRDYVNNNLPGINSPLFVAHFIATPMSTVTRNLVDHAKTNNHIINRVNVVAKVKMVVKIITAMDYLKTLLIHGVSANPVQGVRQQPFKDKDKKIVVLDGVRHYLNKDFLVKPVVDTDSKTGVCSVTRN